MADGAILTVQQAKSYMVVEHEDDDLLISDLIEEAEAQLQGYLQVPITTASFTEYHDGGTSELFLDRYPVDESTVVVTDTQGSNLDATDDEVLAATEYRIYPTQGRVLKTSSTGMRSVWAHGRRRFKVAYDAGLDQHPDWDVHVKAELRGSLRDLVAEWYQNRRPAASSVGEGGGLSHTVAESDRGLPRRVREVWDRWASPLG